MSATLLMNNMRLQAQRAMSRKTSTRYGIVTSFNPNIYAAQVQLQPEPNLYTGFIPVATPWAGNGWGMFAPPTAGNQVCVEFIDGDLTAGFVLAPFFNSQMMPIQGTPQPQSGEFWLVHQSGSFIKLTNDGSISMSAGAGLNFTAPESLFTGDVETTGNLVVGTGASGSFTTGTGQTVDVQDGVVTNIF